MSTYLNHHLTNETLGIELAKRAGAAHKGARLGTFLEMLRLGAGGGPRHAPEAHA